MEPIFQIKSFNSLTVKQFHDIVLLREKIFVVEQECVYQDVDGKDPEAFHLCVLSGEQLAGYCRIYTDAKNHVHIGRVAVNPGFRRKGLAYKIMEHAHAFIAAMYKNYAVIEISAQQYLADFYEKTGYQKSGSVYLEDGIPHIKMFRKISLSP
jgi:ElaA protein